VKNNDESNEENGKRVLIAKVNKTTVVVK